MSTFHELSDGAKKIFTDFLKKKDVSGDGYLNADELEETLQLVGLAPTDANIDFIFEFFDKDKSGKVSISQLMENLDVITVQSVTPADLKAAFEKFDLNKDGFMRLPELLTVLTADDNMPVDDARKLISRLVAKYDHNKDGKFDYNEFAQIVTQELYPLHQWKPDQTLSDEQMMQQTKK